MVNWLVNNAKHYGYAAVFRIIANNKHLDSVYGAEFMRQAADYIEQLERERAQLNAEAKAHSERIRAQLLEIKAELERHATS